MLENTRNFRPMLKPIALLSLVALVGCSTPPTFPTDAATAPAAASRKVQGILSTEIESAEMVPSASQIVQFPVGSGTFLVPVAQADAIPAGAQKILLGPIEGDSDPNHLMVVTQGHTHVAYFTGATPDFKSFTTVTRGGATAEGLEVLSGQSKFRMRFPKSTTGNVTVAFKPESHFFALTQIQTPEEYAQGIIKIAITKSVEILVSSIEELTTAKDVTLTFKVLDAEKKPVSGLTKEYFSLLAYPKPKTGESAQPMPSDITELVDLKDGTYRIKSLVIPATEHGTYRFEIDVLNPSATTTGSFYRKAP